MSDFICACPFPTAIPDITNVTCKESFGLVGKIAFQVLGIPFVDIDDPVEWGDKISAVIPAQKITLTPLTLDSQEIPPSTLITVGGDDNSTFDGAPIPVGETSVTATFIIRDLPISAYKQLKAYTCEVSRTGVYLLGNNFAISSDNDSAIKISSFFIGTPLLGGRTDTNNYPITVTFPVGWWEKAKVNPITAFNPMDLIA